MSCPALEEIAARLEGMEEAIILRLIDRAQFAANNQAYAQGKSGFEGEPTRSLFQIRLLHHEEMDARFGRYLVPEERPFSSGLPGSRRRVIPTFEALHLDDFDSVNLTSTILPDYLRLVPAICAGGDDGHYGSSVEHDVHALQAISRRIHYGAMYVAESKFCADPELYEELIRRGEDQPLLDALSRPEVEARILKRVAEKVDSIQASVNMKVRHRIEPEPIVVFYRDTVIPTTKMGEVMYLRKRRGPGA